MGKKVLLVMMAILLMFSLSACSTRGPGDSADFTVTKGKFTVGFDQDFPPMGFIGDDGEFTGFDLDLAAEVANRLEMELVLQPIAWDSKDSELETKNIDCIWNGFTITGREKDYTWTDPYMKNNQVFVVKEGSAIKTLQDLAGKVVSAQTDSSAEKALRVGRPELVDSFADLISSPDYLTALMDLESGAVDAVAMDDIVASYQIEKKGEAFVLLDETLAAEDYGVGFLLGNEILRDNVQAILIEMAADGVLAEISIKWFGKDVTTIGK